MATTNVRGAVAGQVMDATFTPEAHRPAAYAWAITRIGLGFIFLWAFLDKTFGLGFATPAERAWLNGASPTTGFLKGTGENALGGVFTALAGQGWVDWLFMLGLLGVGSALLLGIGLRITAVAGGGPFAVPCPRPFRRPALTLAPVRGSGPVAPARGHRTRAGGGGWPTRGTAAQVKFTSLQM